MLLRWFIPGLIALILLINALPWLEKLGLGRMPGDLRWRMFGRRFCLPLTSCLLLSLLVLLIGKLLR